MFKFRDIVNNINTLDAIIEYWSKYPNNHLIWILPEGSTSSYIIETIVDAMLKIGLDYRKNTRINMCIFARKEAINIIESIINENELNDFEWQQLAKNPSAIHILEANLNKIKGCIYDALAVNPNAIHILKDNIDKLDYITMPYLAQNPNIASIIASLEVPETLLSKFGVSAWNNLIKNPNIAFNIIESNLDKIFKQNQCVWIIHGNIKTNIDKLNNYTWSNIALNPNAISLIEFNLNKLNQNGWNNLANNPNAISLIESNLDKLNQEGWNNLANNPNAISLIESNLDKLNQDGWNYLTMNPNAFHILKAYSHKICWRFLIHNSNIIQLHYHKMRITRSIILNKQEFVYLILKPKKIIHYLTKYNYNLVNHEYELDWF